MRVSSTTQAPPDTGADTIAVGVFEGEPIAHDVDGALQGLVDSGEARPGLRKVAVAHAGGNRYVLVGLGVSSLSMTPRALPDVADTLAAVTTDECARLAQLALAATTARGAREAVRAMLPILDELGL